MGRTRNRREASEDDFTDRTLERFVSIDNRWLPAYPNHPDRRRARAEGSIDPGADTAQLLQWHAAGDNLNAYAKMLRSEAEDTEAYSRGWFPLWQVHPDDRPDMEVQRDFYGALQEWLAVNLPFLTLEACRDAPARRIRPSRLRVPGNGELHRSDGDKSGAADITSYEDDE